MPHIMKKISATLLFLLFTAIFSYDVYACTSAIFTGKATKDGRPLMYKNRDTGELNNRLEYFSPGQGRIYGFIGLVNSPSKGGEVWAGSNDAGFCIMNTASYNLAIPEEKDLQDDEGKLMFRALSICRTIKDFETFLDTITKPIRIEANFGVIDAEGGAAYYEVNTRNWKKYDANDPTIAPDGVLIYTNFSKGGRKDEGLGYIRYDIASKIIGDAINEKVKFSPYWIMENLSRSFYHSVLDTDLRKSDAPGNGWFIDQDYISRKSTSAVSIFQGVNKGENPKNTIFWCALGYGPLAMLVPTFMTYPSELPSVMVKQGKKSSNCKMCDISLSVKANVFPIKRGNGSKYFNFGKLYNSKGTGYAQKLAPYEKQIADKSEELISLLREDKLSLKNLKSFNSFVDKTALKAYGSLK